MTKSSTRPKKRRPVQAPQRRKPPRERPPLLLIVLAALGIIGFVVAIALLRTSSRAQESTSAGLPQTSDYHSLLVAPDDTQRLLLGTHQGLFASNDGGRTWDATALSGQDAMNLARPSGRRRTIWAAGHNVLAKSTNGGKRWDDVRPAGLPSLDVHGFAADPRDPDVLLAAIAGQGLFRSANGGDSYSLVSTEVGPAVMALAVFRDGRVLAGDMQQGLMASEDGGKTWRRQLAEGVMGLAINPSDPRRVLATGPGILLSQNGGRTWRKTLELADGAGPVAWSRSEPKVAYVVGFDRTLYRTSDGGSTWSAVQ